MDETVSTGGIAAPAGVERRPAPVDDQFDCREATVEERERWGLAVPEPEPCEASEMEIRRWRPTERELESIAIAAEGGMVASDIASKFGKSYAQIRHVLKTDAYAEIANHIRDRVVDSAGFAKAQLDIALPQSAQAMLAICANSGHDKHFDALKWHLSLGLESQRKPDQANVDLHLHMSQNVANVVNDAVPAMRAARGVERVEHPTNNPHLHHGNTIAESRNAELDITKNDHAEQ